MVATILAGANGDATDQHVAAERWRVMSGSIMKRGRGWRLKFEAGPRDANGRRQTRYVTTYGSRKQAQVELIRLLAEVERGMSVDPIKTTLSVYMRDWLENDTYLSPKTVERYRQLLEQQIAPHLGSTLLQKLRPAHIGNWHTTLLK